MGAAAMPSQQGRRHKEALSPAKRRPSGSRPGGSGKEETPREPLLPTHPSSRLRLLPATSSLAHPPPGRCLQGSPFPAALCVPSAPSPAPSSGRRDPVSGPRWKPRPEKGRLVRNSAWLWGRAVPEAEGARGGSGRTCGTCGRGVQRAGGAGIWDGSLADCVLAPVADWAPRRRCRIATPLRVLTSDVCVCMLCVVEIRMGPTGRAASPPQLSGMRMPQPREEAGLAQGHTGGWGQSITSVLLPFDLCKHRLWD